jgi:hypothetical protein
MRLGMPESVPVLIWMMMRNDGLMLYGILPQVAAGALSHRQFKHMLNLMTCMSQPTDQRLGQLGVEQESHAGCNRMIL